MSLKYKDVFDTGLYHKTQFEEIYPKSKSQILYLNQDEGDLDRSLNIHMVLKSINNEKNYFIFLFKFLDESGYSNIIVDDSADKSLEKNSLINFIRYFQEIDKVLNRRKAFLNINDLGFITLRLMSKNANSGYLELAFNKNGKIDFLSLDKDYDPLERKTYVFRGSIETSDRLQKSYKINRLFSILRYLDMENTYTSLRW
ncbi:hypothetical protein VH96_09815 [Acinetobacter indicus]|uniref:hypothetical protein n=1 Tax=Acinetobacter indicus TaxID=756892 RepID=UPI0005F8286F|nr:hypothetical protein [Acinetobacter indicus]KJV43898.1 hypothetical protein VH96_09815 [Acinetobacter indicus]